MFAHDESQLTAHPFLLPSFSPGPPCGGDPIFTFSFFTPPGPRCEIIGCLMFGFPDMGVVSALLYLVSLRVKTRTPIRVQLTIDGNIVTCGPETLVKE